MRENFKIALSTRQLAVVDGDSPTEKMSKALVVGACSGMIATVVTTPFDVIKTKVQTCPNSNARSIWKISSICFEEMALVFFVGLTPRVAKTVPACAIMLSTYEGAKRYFAYQVD